MDSPDVRLAAEYLLAFLDTRYLLGMDVEDIDKVAECYRQKARPSQEASGKDQ